MLPNNKIEQIAELSRQIATILAELNRYDVDIESMDRLADAASRIERLAVRVVVEKLIAERTRLADMIIEEPQEASEIIDKNESIETAQEQEANEVVEQANSIEVVEKEEVIEVVEKEEVIEVVEKMNSTEVVEKTNPTEVVEKIELTEVKKGDSEEIENIDGDEMFVLEEDNGESNLFIPVIDRRSIMSQAWMMDLPGTPRSIIIFGISLNDKLCFIKELFNDDTEQYNLSIDKINSMESMDEVLEYTRTAFPDWDESSSVVYRFYMIVRRKLDV